jgi:hypothetical protein
VRKIIFFTLAGIEDKMSHWLCSLVPGKDVGGDREDGAKALHRPRRGTPGRRAPYRIHEHGLVDAENPITTMHSIGMHLCEQTPTYY